MSQSMHSVISSIFIDNNEVISDHFPLYVTLDFNGLPRGITSNQGVSKIKWSFEDARLKERFYIELMNEYDFKTFYHTNCINGCRDVSHWATLSNVWDRLIKRINKVGFEVFGCTKRKYKIIPGWNQRIKRLYYESRQAFIQWKASGAQPASFEAMEMRMRRADFKHALRECRRDEEELRAESMYADLRSHDARAFWQSVAGGGSSTQPDRIDGAVGEENVANLWANKFSQTLNSLDDEHVKKEFMSALDSYAPSEHNQVTYEEVKSIVRQLKGGKAMGLDGVPNEFYSNSPDPIIIFLSILLNSFIIHNYVPESISNSKIIPLLKSKLLDASSSENYRPITISTAMSKIIEKVILNRIGENIQVTDNQFGYKLNTGTGMCIYSFKEIANMYNKRNTPLFVAFIDIKSAFDKVCYWKVFMRLIERKVPKYIIQFLVFNYVNQSMRVSWGNCMSDSFYMCNGIKQGSILSPYLFNVFLEYLNISLSDTKAGCCIGSVNRNNLSWADDLVLMSPSAHGLNELLEVCDAYAKEHLVTYNTKKTKAMYIKAKGCHIYRLPNIFLSGKTIEYVNEFTYLGHVICNDLSDDADIVNQNRKLCARGNLVSRKFKSCNVVVKRYLFQTYCSTIYCCSLWTKFKNVTLNRIRVNYNNILRRMVGVPTFSSASQLFSLLDLKGFHELRRRACYSLMTRLRGSSNSVVSDVIHSDARLTSDIWRTWHMLLYN